MSPKSDYPISVNSQDLSCLIAQQMQSSNRCNARSNFNSLIEEHEQLRTTLRQKQELVEFQLKLVKEAFENRQGFEELNPIETSIKTIVEKQSSMLTRKDESLILSQVQYAAQTEFSQKVIQLEQRITELRFSLGAKEAKLTDRIETVERIPTRRTTQPALKSWNKFHNTEQETKKALSQYLSLWKQIKNLERFLQKNNKCDSPNNSLQVEEEQQTVQRQISHRESDLQQIAEGLLAEDRQDKCMEQEYKQLQQQYATLQRQNRLLQKEYISRHSDKSSK